jgi:hypothetical protein
VDPGTGSSADPGHGDINATWIPLQSARGAAKLGIRVEGETSSPVYP